jgi:hypothetical protein
MWSAILYLAAILILIGVAIAVIVAIRRHMRGTENGEASGFTLEDIRRWQAAGTVSREEGEQLKRVILESYSGSSGGTDAKMPDKLFQRDTHP